MLYTFNFPHNYYPQLYIALQERLQAFIVYMNYVISIQEKEDPEYALELQKALLEADKKRDELNRLYGEEYGYITLINTLECLITI